MQKSKMKNVVVLKNLPSNLIEEAFVVVKSKKIARSLEYIDGKNGKIKSDCKESDYIVREAESVLFSYANLVEKKEEKRENIPLKRKYNMTKLYGALVTLAFIVTVIF